MNLLEKLRELGFNGNELGHEAADEIQRLKGTSRKKVYLAGAIFGLEDRGQGWRDEAIASINALDNWEPINPNLIEVNKIDPLELINGDFATILQCKAIVANVERPSWGTAMELSFARQNSIPVIAFPFDTRCSPWLKACVTDGADNLQEALETMEYVYGN